CRPPGPNVVARCPRYAAWAGFDVSVSEESPRRWLRVLAEGGQESIRKGESLPATLRGGNTSFKSRNRGPRRRLTEKARLDPPWGISKRPPPPTETLVCARVYVPTPLPAEIHPFSA